MTDFNTLWRNFPDVDKLKQTCFNKQSSNADPFDNYCAILLSECFIKSGISLEKSSSGQKCWSHKGARHVLKAQDLADWLNKSRPQGFGKAERISSATFQNTLAGRTGVVFFKDYWQRGNESVENRSGDHIDLWNRDRISGGSMTYRTIIEFLGLVSDLNKSRQILFWEIK